MRKILFLFLVLVFSTLIADTEIHTTTGPGVQHVADAERDRVGSNSFTTYRPLGDYANYLGPSFMRSLGALNGDSHWVDFGSGEGVAIENYLQISRTNQLGYGFAQPGYREALDNIAASQVNNRAHVTGITYHMHRFGKAGNFRDYGNRIRHLVGRFVENIPAAELGRADLITDVQGAFAYTDRIHEVLAQALRILKRNGSIHIGVSHGFADTRFRTRDGVKLSFVEWLNTIPGIRAVQTQSPGYANMWNVVITKTGGAIKIPNVRQVETDNGPPPTRLFTVADGTITVPDRPDGNGPQANFRNVTVAPAGYRPPANVTRPNNLRRSQTFLGYDLDFGPAKKPKR